MERHAADALVAHFKRHCGLDERTNAAFGMHPHTSKLARDTLYAMWGDLITHDIVDCYTLTDCLRGGRLHTILQMHYPAPLCNQVLTDGRLA